MSLVKPSRQVPATTRSRLVDGIRRITGRFAPLSFGEVEDDFFAREADLYPAPEPTGDHDLEYQARPVQHQARPVQHQARPVRLSGITRVSGARTALFLFGRLFILAAVITGGTALAFMRMTGVWADNPEVSAAVPATSARATSTAVLPTAPKPAATELAAAEPAVPEPVAAEPVVPEPVAAEPAPAAAASIDIVDAKPSALRTHHKRSALHRRHPQRRSHPGSRR